MVTPCCAIQTWGHRHIITARRHHHRGSCCCFSLCHWCNWKNTVQSVTAENTQYNPSNSDCHWCRWKYMVWFIKQPLVHLKIYSTMRQTATVTSTAEKNTGQSVKQPLSLLQLKIHSTIRHTVTVTGTAENTLDNLSDSDHHWCSWKYIHLYCSEKKFS